MSVVTTTTSGDFRNHLADYLNRIQYAGERTLITRNGRAIAAVVSTEDLALLQALEDRIDGEAADEAIREAKEAGMIPWDQVR
jgi:prevent-host-death family protein